MPCFHLCADLFNVWLSRKRLDSPISCDILFWVNSMIKPDFTQIQLERERDFNSLVRQLQLQVIFFGTTQKLSKWQFVKGEWQCRIIMSVSICGPVPALRMDIQFDAFITCTISSQILTHYILKIMFVHITTNLNQKSPLNIGKLASL